MLFDKRLNIICGHYGAGKTNFAVNLALDLKKQGKSVTLVDLDIVNPYFRSADFKAKLGQQGIKVIAPAYANTNLDIPALTAEIQSVFGQCRDTVVIDVGGDDAGAAALGRYAGLIREEDDYNLFSVINCYRYLTRKPEEAVRILHEIERMARLSATGIVNNSNLSDQTTAQTVKNSIAYAKEVAARAGLPLVAHVYRRELQEQLAELEPGYPVEVYVRPPWAGSATDIYEA